MAEPKTKPHDLEVQRRPSGAVIVDGKYYGSESFAEYWALRPAKQGKVMLDNLLQRDQ